MSLIVISQDTRFNMKISLKQRALTTPLRLEDLRSVEKQFELFIVLSTYQLGKNGIQKFSIYNKYEQCLGIILSEFGYYFSLNDLRNQLTEKRYLDNKPTINQLRLSSLSISNIRDIELHLGVFIILTKIGSKHKFTIYDEDGLKAGEIEPERDNLFFTEQMLINQIHEMEAFDKSPGL